MSTSNPQETNQEPPAKKKHWIATALVGALVFILGNVSGLAIQRYVPSLLSSADKVVGYQPLVAEQLAWPREQRCDAATTVAMPHGLVSGADIISTTEGQDFRDAVVAAGGGAYLLGHLTIALATKDGSTAHITQLTTTIYRSYSASPAWIAIPAATGCGGINVRLFQANLDKGGRVIDKGMQLATENLTPGLKNQPLGPDFTVSGIDQSDIVLDAISCHASYDWSVSIHYFVGDHQYVYTLGSKDAPLRSLGLSAADTSTYVVGFTSSFLEVAGKADRTVQVPVNPCT